MRSLLKFFSLTYVVSWIFFAAAAAISGWTAAPTSGLATIRALLFLLGTIAPALVALALTAQADGRVGTLALLRRIFQWEVDARWYVFALGFMALIKVAVALVHRLAIGAWPAFGQTPFFIMAVPLSSRRQCKQAKKLAGVGMRCHA